jgi:DNA-binding response OmpR family regulator
MDGARHEMDQVLGTVDRGALHTRVTTAIDALHAQRARLESILEACRDTAGAVAVRSGEGRPDGIPRLFAAQVVSLGAVEILVRQQAIREGSHIRRLTPTEWQLLIFLLSRPDEVHSRAQVAAGAWGGGYADRNSEVEVYISRLRRKLGAAGGMVETVRGLGYRLALSPPPAEPQA